MPTYAHKAIFYTQLHVPLLYLRMYTIVRTAIKYLLIVFRIDLRAGDYDWDVVFENVARDYE